MERPAIFENIGRNYFLDFFNELVNLESRKVVLCVIEKICMRISEIRYVRGKDFDNLSKLIFFNIGKGHSINPNFRNAIYYFLRSLDSMYMVDFFSILPGITFGRMRVVFSDEEMLAMLIEMENDGIVGIIENPDARGEIERFLSDMFRSY